MAWDQRYRILQEGETILATDEVEVDDPYGWEPPNPRTIGTPAPSPLYTSHRRYRRIKDAAAKESKDDHQQFMRLADTLVEDVFEASDEEIVQEMGGDVNGVRKRINGSVAAALAKLEGRG